MKKNNHKHDRSAPTTIASKTTDYKKVVQNTRYMYIIAIYYKGIYDEEYYSYFTLLGGMGGGKGVYSFFCRTLNGLVLFFWCVFLNLGRNFSQFASFNFGFFISSCFIINVYTHQKQYSK